MTSQLFGRMGRQYVVGIDLKADVRGTFVMSRKQRGVLLRAEQSQKFLHAGIADVGEPGVDSVAV